MTEIVKSLLSKNLVTGINELGEEFHAIQIFDELKILYPNKLQKKIISVRFYQTKDDCFIEITKLKRNYSHMMENASEIELKPLTIKKDFQTKRESLSFITINDNLYFNPENSIVDNTWQFLYDFDDHSKLHTMDLFSKIGIIQLLMKK